MKAYREGITEGIKVVEALKYIAESMAKLTEPLCLFCYTYH